MGRMRTQTANADNGGAGALAALPQATVPAVGRKSGSPGGHGLPAAGGILE